MIKTELASEGCATPAAQKASGQYNECLRTNPEHIIRAISHLALAPDHGTPEELTGAATAINDVLDTTNQGSQIGLHEHGREAAWGEIFDDPSHKAARDAYNEQVTKERSLEFELADARQQRETLDVSNTEYQTLTFRIKELEEQVKQAIADSAELRRQRGLCALRAVAVMNTDSQLATATEPLFQQAA